VLVKSNRKGTSDLGRLSRRQGERKEGRKGGRRKGGREEGGRGKGGRRKGKGVRTVSQEE
jgi:hypothetical protein